jgi:hypothetical protein
MKSCFPAALLAVALGSSSFCMPACAGLVSSGGRVGGFGHHGWHTHPVPVAVATVPRYRRFSTTFAGGGSDVDTADYDEDDSVGNLHFRVQEPFGPWDIGRQPPASRPAYAE